jgi:hypothetical protein
MAAERPPRSDDEIPLAARAMLRAERVEFLLDGTVRGMHGAGTPESHGKWQLEPAGGALVQLHDGDTKAGTFRVRVHENQLVVSGEETATLREWVRVP